VSMPVAHAHIEAHTAPRPFGEEAPCDPGDWMEIAKELASAANPAGTAAWVIANLPLADLGEVRDILGFDYPEVGVVIGPHAGDAYLACTAELERRARR
jgi:hypothetical protein